MGRSWLTGDIYSIISNQIKIFIKLEIIGEEKLYIFLNLKI